MATPPSPTSPTHWTQSHLRHFNIQIKPTTSIYEFFGLNSLPPNPSWSDPSYASFITASSPSSPDALANLPIWRILDLLQWIHSSNSGNTFTSGPGSGSESELLLVSFIHRLLEMLSYDLPEKRCIRMKHSLRLLMGGEYFETEMSCAVVDARLRGCLLAVVSDAASPGSFGGSGGKGGGKDAVAHLVGECVAAFQMNNSIRCDILMKPRLQAAIIPGIILRGTYPIFYRLPITEGLSQAVASNTPPHHPTTILAYAPPIDPRYISGGLWEQKNRQVILQVFEAFKAFVPDTLCRIPPAWLRFIPQGPGEGVDEG